MLECSVLLADYKILIRAQYESTVRQCADYRLPTPLRPEEADLVVSASPAEMEAELKAAPMVPPASVESVCIYREICRRIPLMGGMLLHAAVISDGAHGYAFTANSGTGKTTHIRLWQKAFGERVRVINGDKPILRRREGKWYAYGTPWCGKEGWNVNAAVPLSAICFLRRGETNQIAPYDAARAVTEILPQLLLPDDPAALAATLDLLDSLLTEVPLYELYCTISEEAAHVALNAMCPRAD